MRDQKGYHDLRLPVGLVYVSLGLKKTEDNPNSNFKASSCDHFQVLSAYHALSYTKSFISLTSYIQPHTIFFYYPLRSHSSNHSSVGRTVHSLEPPGASPPEPRRRRYAGRIPRRPGSHLSPRARPSGALWRRSRAPSSLPTSAAGRRSVGFSLGALTALPPHPVRLLRPQSFIQMITVRCQLFFFFG